MWSKRRINKNCHPHLVDWRCARAGNFYLFHGQWDELDPWIRAFYVMSGESKDIPQMAQEWRFSFWAGKPLSFAMAVWCHRRRSYWPVPEPHWKPSAVTTAVWTELFEICSFGPKCELFVYTKICTATSLEREVSIPVGLILWRISH